MKPRSLIPLTALLAVLLLTSACAEGVALRAGVATVRKAAETRLDLTILSFCGTPYATLVCKGDERKALARAAQELCGTL